MSKKWLLFVFISLALFVPLMSLGQTAGKLFSLKVEGFKAAAVVYPEDAKVGPKPVVVVLHGNFDRPEWECEWWKEAASFYGWVLCPRGVRTPYATLAEDRWTYGNAAATSREIHAGLKSLEEAHPGRVSRDGMVLAGFSLGAIMGPRIVEMNPGFFSTLFLVEGGIEKLNASTLRALKRDGIRGIGMAMSAPGRRKAAQALLDSIRKEGMRAEYVDMKGAGHGYRNDFPINGNAALRRLITEPSKIAPDAP